MAEKLTINYTTSGNYTLSDSSKIEVASGVARLKDLGGATYSTDNPTVLHDTVTTADRLILMNEFATKPTSTEVKYTLYVDSQDIYHDGTNWIDSDGTYSQSNTMAELIADIDRLDIDNFQLRAFLNTTVSTSRPLLDKVEIFYEAFPQTSNSFNHNLTRNQIIEEAFRAVGAVASGNSLSNEQYSRGANLLNSLLASWRSRGIQVWNERKITIPLHDGVEVLGSDGLDYECIESHIASTNTVPVTGPEYMTFWRVLSTTAGAAHVIGKKYISSNQYELPSEVFSIEGAYIREASDYIPLTIITKEDYRTESRADSTGKPTRLYFKRGFIPEIFILPYPDSLTNYVLEVDVLVYPQDFDQGSDNPDLLIEWHLALQYGLAKLLGPSRGISAKQYSMIKDLAKEHLDSAMESNHEAGDLQIVPAGVNINDRTNY